MTPTILTGLLVKCYPMANDFSRRTVSTLPEALTEHDDALRPLFFVSGAERTAENRLNPEHIEETASDLRDVCIG